MQFEQPAVPAAVLGKGASGEQAAFDGSMALKEKKFHVLQNFIHGPVYPKTETSSSPLRADFVKYRETLILSETCIICTYILGIHGLT